MRAVFLSFLNEVGNIFRLGVTNLSSNKELDIDVGSIGPDKIPKVSGDGNSVTFVDGAAARTAIGLGSMATQNANAVAIAGGTGSLTSLNITGTTPSTSTTTGAAVVAGGLGVGGRVSATNFNGIQQSLVGSGLRWGNNNTAPVAVGNFWMAQGFDAARENVNGNGFLAQGVAAGRNNVSGSSWVAQANNAGFSNIDGSFWMAQGPSAGRNNVSGSSWMAQGLEAGLSNIDGSFWMAQGPGAARNNLNGSGFIAQGFEAGYNRQGSNWWIVSNSRDYDFIYGEMDNNNLSLMKAGDNFGGGSGALKLPVATTVPTSNPTSGFLIYQKPTGEVCVRDQSGEKAVTGANAGAFTGPITTTDATESTSTTTGSIRGAGAGFTGNLYVGGLTSIQGVTLEKINSLLYTPTQKRGIVTNNVSLSQGTIGVSVNHPSPESIVGRFDFFHTAGDQGILVEGGGSTRGWIFYVLQNELWWHAGDATNTGDIPGRFEGSVLIEPGLNTVEFYFSVSQESKVFLNGRLVAQKQITLTSPIHFGSDPMYFWGSGTPAGGWPVNYLPPELVVPYPTGSKGLFAYAFNLSVDLLSATGTIIRFADGSTLAPNANGDLVFTSKNNNTTTMALA